MTPARLAVRLLTSLVLVAAGSAARAQLPDIPCEIGRWPGGGFLMPSVGLADIKDHRLAKLGRNKDQVSYP